MVSLLWEPRLHHARTDAPRFVRPEVWVGGRITLPARNPLNEGRAIILRHPSGLRKPEQKQRGEGDGDAAPVCDREVVDGRRLVPLPERNQRLSWGGERCNASTLIDRIRRL